MIPRIGSIPTLLIWGDMDAAVNPRSAEPLQKQFENCQTVILNGVGHVAYEEVPEEFSSVVVQYLSKPEW
jgi:pimeloyl-ACP methyl ester carboxylesterase